MKIGTADRGEIVHFAGRHRLSPALRDGAPAFAGASDLSPGRCGWEYFFAALEKRRLALVYDPENPGAAELVPWRQAEGLGQGGASLHAALEHAARFTKALFSKHG